MAETVSRQGRVGDFHRKLASDIFYCPTDLISFQLQISQDNIAEAQFAHRTVIGQLLILRIHRNNGKGILLVYRGRGELAIFTGN